MQVVIIKQPLYGTVEWNGVKFNYTPLDSSSQNKDYFVYSIGDGVLYTYYIDPTLNGFTNNISLSTVPLTSIVIPINLLTNLTDSEIIGVDPINVLFGYYTFDKKNIYYNTSLINSLDSFIFTIKYGLDEYTNNISIYTSNGVDIYKVYYTEKEKTDLIKDNLNYLKSLSVNYNSYTNVLNEYSDDWNLSESLLEFYNYLYNDNKYQTLTSIYENNVPIYDSLSALLTQKSGNWTSTYNIITSVSSFINNVEYIYNDLFNITTSSSSNWNQNIDSIENSKNETYVLSSKLKIVNDLYNQNINKWGTSKIDYISSNKIDNWDSTGYILSSSTWSNLTNDITGLSASIIENSDEYNSTVLTISLCNNIWYRSFDPIKTKILPNYVNWEMTFDVLNPNYGKWDNFTSTLTTFTGRFVPQFNRFDSLSSTINNQSIVSGWEYSKNLSGSLAQSGNWNNTYQIVNSLSSNWFFSETPQNIGFYTPIESFSANWNTNITSSVNTWNRTNSISSVSSRYLTGGNNINYISKDLKVFGTTFIKGNLSAFGSSFTINTDIYTTESFDINNDSNNDALTIKKGLGFETGIADFYTIRDNVSSSVLYVRAPNKVSINTYQTSDDLALNINGDLSASGNIFPETSYFTGFTENSAKYQTSTTYITGVSANTNILINEKSRYDNLSNYVLLSSSLITSTVNSSGNFVNLFNIVRNQSSFNTQVNNLIVSTSANFDKDTLYRANSASIEDATLYIDNYKLAPYNITQTFSYLQPNSDTPSIIVPSSKQFFVVQDDIKIQSYTIISDVNCVATVRLLSSNYSNFDPTINSLYVDSDIVKMTLNNTSKEYNEFLTGWKTDISKDSILTFNVVSNNLASSLIIILKVVKK